MILEPIDTQLLNSLRHAEQIRRNLSPDHPAGWQDYVEALRGVSLVNWSETTEIQMQFALMRTVINEIR
jgi:hypothetical protein